MKRSIFVEKQESKSPINLQRLSQSGPGIAFFNSNTGSSIHEVDRLPFALCPTTPVDIASIFESLVQGNFTVEGKLSWNREEREVLVGSNRTKRRVRDAIIADNSGNIPISIWGDLIDSVTEDFPTVLTNIIAQDFNGLKLSTTTDTELRESMGDFSKVDWNMIKPLEVLETIHCPSIACVKVSQFEICNNLDCKKKLTPYPGQATVTCNMCKRKMLLERCDTTFVCEITVELADGRQQPITIFPNTLAENLPDVPSDDLMELEHALLILKDVDFEINGRSIVTKIVYGGQLGKVEN